MIFISKCPYCNKEIEFKVSMGQVSIDDEYKNAIVHAVDTFLTIRANNMPFGTSMSVNVKNNMFVRFMENLLALPVTILSCKNCDTVINAEIFKTREALK